MKALVTGGAGFIGSHLVERLIGRGFKTTVIDDLSTGAVENLAGVATSRHFSLERSPVEACENLESLVASCDLVFHLAAAVGVQYVMAARVRTIQTNLDSTRAILQQAGRFSIPVFLASTSEVYGSVAAQPLSENDPLRLASPDAGRWCYAASKVMCEFLALAHAFENQLPIVIGRLFNTSGRRQSPDFGMVLPRFVRQALSGEPITVYGDGTQSRCFVHVSDVVDAIIRLMETPGARGEIFNIGSAEETSIGTLAERVKHLTNSSSKIIFEPHDRICEGFMDMQRRVPDLSKISASIGYEPTVGLDDIIRDVARHL